MASGAEGKVWRIYQSPQAFDKTGATFFRLKDLPRDQSPGGPDASEDSDYQGYFFLLPSDATYNAVYSLLLVAATNGYTVKLRTWGEIKPWRSASDTGENAHVRYIYIDW